MKLNTENFKPTTELGNDAKRVLPAVNVDLMNEILQRNFEQFRLSIGLLPDEMSERAKEYFRKSLEEYSENRLKEFCDHLNTYKGLEDCRFDFMLVDFNGR